MTVTRHEPSTILSKVVEANGFVFTAGVVADDVKQDVKGQTQQILSEIDRLLKLAGTDKTKVVSATIWVADIRTREAMNEAVDGLDRRREPARPRLHRSQARQSACAGGDRGGRRQIGAAQAGFNAALRRCLRCVTTRRRLCSWCKRLSPVRVEARICGSRFRSIRATGAPQGKGPP